VDRETYYQEKFGGREKVAAITAQLSEVGRELDIDFDFEAVKVQPNTRLSHCLITLAEGPRQSAVKEAVLSAFFEQGKDIGDPAVLLDIARETALDEDRVRTLLASDELQTQVGERAEMARASGISGVPTFIFDSAQGFSGAQPEAVFLEIFDQLAAKQANNG
jgi:predicted DsbA family dithiol-disulfide isomerase